MQRKFGILLVSVVFLAVLSGCGSNSSSLVVSSNPENGANGVVVGNSAMEVTLAKDLDASTVNGTTVTLRGQDSFTGRPVLTSGEVNYVAHRRTITFTPTGGLSGHSCSYTLKLAGLKDTGGNALPEIAISFSTATVKAQLSASGLDAVFSDGSPAGSYYRSVYDSAGNPVRTVQYGGAGQDGVWFTADDRVDSYGDSTYDPSSKTMRQVLHPSPGPDGVWFTADDTVGSCSVYSYSDGKEITVNYNGAGGDGVWFTPDDTVSGYTITAYNGNGTVSSMIYYGDPGPDGKWFTADDVYYNYVTFLYDANGNATRIAYSAGAGPDGIPFTADDQPMAIATSPGGATTSTVLNRPGIAYYTLTYDANNRLLSSASYEDPGQDGVWFTPDDVFRYYQTDLRDADGRVIRRASSWGGGPDGIPFTADDSYSVEVCQSSNVGGTSCSVQTFNNTVWYEAYSYDAGGNLIRTVSYNNPGSDGVWFTADDRISSYTAFTLNGAGKPARSTYGGPGADGAWFTADDTVNGYADYSYDAAGHQTRVVNYYAFGPDGVPLTADDRPSFYEVTTYDASGRISGRMAYSGPGPDGVWFTGDDILSSKDEFSLQP